tara:strand:- start:172 stop:339 length:168 start_codon:yes stop_codon:yes gene_type:complete
MEARVGLDVVLLVLGAGVVNFIVAQALERRLERENASPRAQVAALSERVERLEKH